MLVCDTNNSSTQVEQIQNNSVIRKKGRLCSIKESYVKYSCKYLGVLKNKERKRIIKS